ncbi:nucleolar transcription factor 1-like [Enoplosus armatus]|uniref:nucleolar transcription factor 1-like n=1 Tax=Enoplosus armatus TaxID=215367 RepID=UPI00399191E7
MIVKKLVDWTRENLLKLLAAMKTSIPDHDRSSAYPRGLKTLDWNEVAFPPFSPEACHEKWREIFQKMRKIRTLTELLIEAEDVISNPSLDNKVHPELPKKPSPPNAIYFEENWAKFHQQHPELSYKKVFAFVNKSYQDLPDEVKSQYSEKYQLSIKEYDRRILEFRQQYQKRPNRKLRTKQKRKRKRVSADSSDGEQLSADADGLPPKPPVNGYSLFSKEQMSSMADISTKAYIRVWAQRWRDLTDTQREEYNIRCSELKTQYTIKLNEYLMTLDEEEQQRILDKYGIKRPKKRKGNKMKQVKTFPGEPKMPSRSANVIFCKEQMELMKEKIPNARERFIKCNKSWHDIPNKEKERYRGRVHENIRKYSLELQKWFKV